MAGLKEYSEKGDDLLRIIPLPSGGKLSVGGLSLADVTRLVRARTIEMEMFFDKFMADMKPELESPDPKFKKRAQMAEKAANQFSMELLGSAPDVAADIIALASGEPTLTAVARTLPFPVQLEALEAIADLTFVGEDGLKKVVETVIRAVVAARATFEDLNASRIGSLVSAVK